MTKAFAYLRVSGKGQLDGDGFDRQREAIQTYADQQGITIVEWFEERGVCGATEWEDRPAWSEMIGRLNGVRTILVERLDRLARQLMVQEYILADLRKRDVVLLTSANEDTSDEDPTRVLFRQIVGAIAQYDRVMIVRKMKHARDKMRKETGRCEGRKPFGHRQGEAETIAFMSARRAEGITYDDIADILNTKGFPTRNGKQWFGATVSKILNRAAE